MLASLKSSMSDRGRSDSYAFIRSGDCEKLKRSLHEEWSAYLRCCNEQSDETICLRLHDFKGSETEVPVRSKSPNTWSIPVYADEEIRRYSSKIFSLSASQIKDALITEFGWLMTVSSHSEGHRKFWTISFESVRRKLGDNETSTLVKEIVVDHPHRSDGTKTVPSYRGLKHVLFGLFFLLKLQVRKCDSYSALSELMMSLTSSSEVVVLFRQTYKDFALLDVQRKQAHEDFITAELLPLSLREIPFPILQRVSLLAFDVDLFPEDHSKMWSHAINDGFCAKFRFECSYHVWGSELVALESRSLKGIAVDEKRGGQHSSVPQSAHSSIAIPDYEAPWTFHNLGAQPKSVKKHQADTKTSSAPFATARMFRMEGRHEQKRNSQNWDWNSDQNFKALNACAAIGDKLEDLCSIVEDCNGDEFSIKRSSLDTMLNDFEHCEERKNDDPIQSEAKDTVSATDVLGDLLSPVARKVSSFPDDDTEIVAPNTVVKASAKEEAPFLSERAKRLALHNNERNEYNRFNIF